MRLLCVYVFLTVFFFSLFLPVLFFALTRLRSFVPCSALLAGLRVNWQLRQRASERASEGPSGAYQPVSLLCLPGLPTLAKVSKKMPYCGYHWLSERRPANLDLSRAPAGIQRSSPKEDLNLSSC
jgi:hypothetical protein